MFTQSLVKPLLTVYCDMSEVEWQGSALINNSWCCEQILCGTSYMVTLIFKVKENLKHWVNFFLLCMKLRVKTSTKTLQTNKTLISINTIKKDPMSIDQLYYLLSLLYFYQMQLCTAGCNECIHLYMAQPDPYQQTNTSPWELWRNCEIEMYLFEISNVWSSTKCD